MPRRFQCFENDSPDNHGAELKFTQDGGMLVASIKVDDHYLAVYVGPHDAAKLASYLLETHPAHP